MDNIRLDLFGFMKKAVHRLLLFIFTQITTNLIINTIETAAELIIRLANFMVG